jgi:hypothetical protein
MVSFPPSHQTCFSQCAFISYEVFHSLAIAETSAVFIASILKKRHPNKINKNPTCTKFIGYQLKWPDHKQTKEVKTHA